MLKLSDNELHWYVANTCRQEKKIKQRLDSMGIENFIPFQQIARKIHGVDKLIEVPVIPNLVFIHTTLKTCMSLIQEYAFDMRYLRDRETGNFLIVPDKQMNDFMFLLDFSKEMVEVVNENLKKGDKVQMVGFGTFEVVERAEREGRNPQTGETMKIAASKTPKFKAGKALKDAIN